MEKITERRKMLKANFKELNEIKTDQQNNIPPPSLESPIKKYLKKIALPELKNSEFSSKSIKEVISSRRSIRKYSGNLLSLQELSFLLWATQGVKEVFKRGDKAIASFRNVPSAGARHPFETYLIILNVDDLEQGIYRYSALENTLYFLFKVEDLPQRITDATLGQAFSGKSNAVFVWSCVPYRAEWRYSISSHKGILLDAGHVCQNLYLACEEVECGTCAIAAYDQQKMDKLLQLDGEEELVVYLAPVGKIK